jgi:hypothetical protein
MQSARTIVKWSPAITRSLPGRIFHFSRSFQASRQTPRTCTGKRLAATLIIPIPAVDTAQALAHVGISEIKDVASYNWLEKPTPTILVPGVPPVWHTPQITPQLRPDTGKRTRYIDENHDRNPSSPLEPLLRAVTTKHPGFDFNTLDIITDRQPIRYLLESIDGRAQDFVIRIEVLGETALLTRMEKKTSEIIRPGIFRGYRDPFEHWYTRMARSAQGSTSHYRVVRYHLGALQLLVRSAADGYLNEGLPDQQNLATPDGPDTAERFRPQRPASPTSSGTLSEDASEMSGMTVVLGGKEIARSALFELTTRSKSGKKPFDIQTKLPELWLSQISYYIIARHETIESERPSQAKELTPPVQFNDIEVKNIKEELQNWEERNQTNIQKLVIVLQQILREARTMGGPCAVTYSRADRFLTMSKIDRGRIGAIPEDLKGKFFGN